MADRAKMENHENDLVPSFEQPMVMDTISAIRKDMKEASRRIF